MSPVPLTSGEWDEINASLPEVSDLCNRIRLWLRMEYISASNLDQLSRVRLSQVCFRDAANCLDNARYALGQAIGVRKHFLSQSTGELDSNRILADLRSRFYADYVSLLLYSTAEHTRFGILEMLGLKTLIQNYPGKYKLAKTLNALEALHSGNPITAATRVFDASDERHRTWAYRDKWVHDQPMRVETVLYTPPRRDFVRRKDKDWPWDMALMGAKAPFDFTWEELISLLKSALQVTADFLSVCSTEWESFYSQIETEYRSILGNDDEKQDE